MPQWEVHSFGDAAQDAADTATAQQQHALALDAYQARQVGDFARYAADIQQLEALGVHNASTATQQDLLDLANQAAVGGTFATIETVAKVVVLIFAAYLGLEVVKALKGGRRGA